MSESDVSAKAADVRQLGLLLIDGFALMSYASVIEPYRAANMLAGRILYDWIHISLDGGAAHASNGAMIVADRAIGSALECDTLFIFAGGDPIAFDDARTFAWLRHVAARGAMIAGISAGPYLMARAGLLDGYRATIHWEHRAAFEAAFPATLSSPGLFVLDRRRLTCAGGLAGMDLALELIERDHGSVLSMQVADWFIRSEPRAADRPQRRGVRLRYGISNDRVAKVLAHMEANLEMPADRATLARIAGVSIRQLERLFLTQLGATPRDVYMRIRLEQSERLLRTTGIPATDIGLACGFRSSSHFSRSYKTRYGRAPSDERRRSDGKHRRGD